MAQQKGDNNIGNRNEKRRTTNVLYKEKETKEKHMNQNGMTRHLTHGRREHKHQKWKERIKEPWIKNMRRSFKERKSSGTIRRD